MKIILTIAGFAALTACQTTTNAASVNLSPATATAGAAMTGTVTASANNGDAVTITIDGSTIAGVTRDTNLDRGAFRAFTRIDATASQPLPTNLMELGHSGDTADGAMSASIASSSGWSPNGFKQAATYARNGSTSMPTSGTATLSGKYVGSWGSADSGQEDIYGVTGDTTLTADFGASTIAGTITGRKMIRYDGTEPKDYADVTLGAASISADGTYAGTATGGIWDNGAGDTVTDVSGSWAGMIGGATGNQAAGVVRLDKMYNVFTAGGVTPTHVETGVFLAE